MSESKLWVCNKCAYITEWGYSDLVERGAPVCPDCTDDLRYIDPVQPFFYLWLNDGEESGLSDDGLVELIADHRDSDNPAVFLRGCYAEAPLLMALLARLEKEASGYTKLLRGMPCHLRRSYLGMDGDDLDRLDNFGFYLVKVRKLLKLFSPRDGEEIKHE